MKLIKEGTEPFRQIYLVGNKILKIQETNDDSILQYASKHQDQFAKCLESWQEDGLYYYLFEKLDNVVDKMKLNPKQLYSMFVQVALILRQLRRNHWVWWDLHDGNIGAVKCNGNITIDGVTVPSHGYRFKL